MDLNKINTWLAQPVANLYGWQVTVAVIVIVALAIYAYRK